MLYILDYPPKDSCVGVTFPFERSYQVEEGRCIYLVILKTNSWAYYSKPEGTMLCYQVSIIFIKFQYQVFTLDHSIYSLPFLLCKVNNLALPKNNV